jgi:HD-like signal output (HDOD) protein/CheY-like chemotaxis protein
VDDEPMVLSGLKRSLNSMKQEWEMVFVAGGQEALQAMAMQPFDIIVTDMRMPVMNGAQLLEEIKIRFPQCLRFILSGQADRESILKTVDPAHQFLSKPCEATELKSRLTRALTIRNLLQNPELRGLVSKLESLPTLPTLYMELNKELNKDEPSVSRIGQLVSEDMALTAKMLQLVNSAFFGLPVHHSSASRAVLLLGLDIIRALVLSTHVFSKFQTNLLNEADVEYLWKHSTLVASHARKIAMHEKVNQRMVDECFTSGLLHDLGKLTLASALGEKYRDVLSLVRNTGMSIVPAEVQLLGCTHAEIAAYLLSVWGLSDNVIEGVAWHHRPSESNQTGFSTVVATHVACMYDEEQNPYWLADGTSFDFDYIRKIDCLEKEQEWRRILQDAPPIQ